MIRLLRTHANIDKRSRLLDLACGKGAASVLLSKEFGCTAKGIDLISEFITEAKEKASEYGVDSRCAFIVGDVNEAVSVEQDYDLTIWGSAGDLLGSYPKTLQGIAHTVKAGGYILLDDAYLPDESQHLRFCHNYLTKAQWEQLFQENALTVLACIAAEQKIDPEAYTKELNNIRKRAEELAQQYPDKRELFGSYVKNQQAEYEDLQDGCIGVLWLLQKTGSL